MTVQTEAMRRLTLAHPIVQGPFGGQSTPQLVAAVAERGGLGSYGAVGLEPNEIVAIVAEIRALTSGPFAVNLWVSVHDPGGLTLSREDFERYWPIYRSLYEELAVPMPEPPASFLPSFGQQIEALIESRPPAFSFVFGIPSAAVLAECRRRGIATIGAATTLDEAEALDSAGVDLIVATGFEAAGHRPSFLKPAEASLMGTFALTQIAARKVKTPVIAAGGIVDGSGIRAVLTLGAQAAQLGTAFLACSESGASDTHRAALFGPDARTTRLTRTYTGRLARGIPNRLVEEIERHSALPPFPIHAWFLAALKPAAAEADRADLTVLYAGQSTPNLRHRTVPALMEALIEDLG